MKETGKMTDLGVAIMFAIGALIIALPTSITSGTVVKWWIGGLLVIITGNFLCFSFFEYLGVDTRRVR